MRLASLVLGSLMVMSVAVAAETDTDGSTHAVAWDDFDDPDFEPGEAPSAPSRPFVASANTQAKTQNVAPGSPIEIEGPTLVVGGVTLGPVGVDAAGHVGRVHTVRPGDTLWDVSNAYLGTAWVWPSVWKDNREILNPNLIQPGDRLWISSTEIRPISEAEADAYVADAETLQGGSTGEEEGVVDTSQLPVESKELDEIPAASDEFAQTAVTDDSEISEMDQLPVGMPDAGGADRATGRTVRVATRENLDFVSDVQIEAATTILGSPSDRQNLSLLDTIYLGLGQGEVEVGDEFTLFRNATAVRSPSTHELIGYHVEALGWAEVTEVTSESSVAVIRVSLAGALRGDRVMPRHPIATEIEVKFPEQGIAGEIAFMPANRTLMGSSDYVFVDVGAVQGVEIGTDLEVYDPGFRVYDASRDRKQMTPDHVIADLVVVNVQEESAVAFVAQTRRELAVGDVVRGATKNFTSAF